MLETTRLGLTTEIAVRERSVDWVGYYQLLPDPDVVAAKKGLDTADWLSVLRFILTDPHVWACYQSRKSGTLSREWEVKPAGTGRKDKRALEAIEEWIGSIDVDAVISDALEAPFFGMSPLEVVWGKGDQWFPERIVGRPPEWFAFETAGDLRFLSRYHQIDGEVLPDKKFLLARHAGSYRNPYGERLLSRCFWPVTFKTAGLKFWTIFTEKYGMPWVWGKVPTGTDDDTRARIKAVLEAMVQDAVIVTNADESVELLDNKSKTASADIYEKLAKHSDYQISKAVLGQTLTTETGDKGGGSYALGEVHNEVRGDLLEQDQRMVAGVFNTLFRWICQLNFPDSGVPVFDFFQEENVQLEKAERDVKLSQAMAGSRLGLSRKYWEINYNLDPDWLEEIAPNATPVKPESDETKDFAEKKTPGPGWNFWKD